ncbi:hypothetical protein GHT06_019894 [Daphnia sinensis]|uniref:tRNA:m(4)X modification enzyme TRM13 n=1 Tax=Daphnia sinensis TaxID=1820382 RepID=A0AAD5L266_9CRUS|nr:hypothetical protein GHT06_019894 [Daphnia sinensis]
MEECHSISQPLPAYIKENINVIGNEEEMKVDLKIVRANEFLALIARISRIHSEVVGELPVSVGCHPILESTLASLKEGQGNWRHFVQNSSILYNMEKFGVFLTGETPSTYIDFGSGRGQLSYVVSHVVNRETDALLAIDTFPHRQEHDKRYKLGEGGHAPIHRVQANIADLDLGHVPLIRDDTRRIVGIGKHLCGAAADLALNCLHRANDPVGLVQGVCMAFCCHHRCTWRDYVGKAFFKKLFLSQRDFTIMKAMTSWAVCGSGQAQERNDPVQENEVIRGGFPNFYVTLGLDVVRRMNIGRQCKQIIDRGRAEFLSSWSLEAKLLCYVEPDSTPENVLLLAQRP